MTLDTDLAEDLVGRALLKAVASWSKFDGKHPRAWLIRILRNEYLMHLREVAARPTECQLFEDSATASDEADHNLFLHLSNVELLAALDSLPAQYREVIALCDIEEISPKEVAQILGVPHGTIASRLSRGRRLLRELILQKEQGA